MLRFRCSCRRSFLNSLEKCVLTVLELNWNQSLGLKKTKLNICHHTLALSKHLQNRSFDVVERTRTSTKCQKMKNARAKRAKVLFFIVKYANLWGFCCRRRRGCLVKPGFHIVVSVVSVVQKKFIGQIEFILSRTTRCICHFYCIEQLYGRFP